MSCCSSDISAEVFVDVVEVIVVVGDGVVVGADEDVVTFVGIEDSVEKYMVVSSSFSVVNTNESLVVGVASVVVVIASVAVVVASLVVVVASVDVVVASVVVVVASLVVVVSSVVVMVSSVVAMDSSSNSFAIAYFVVVSVFSAKKNNIINRKYYITI